MQVTRTKSFCSDIYGRAVISLLEQDTESVWEPVVRVIYHFLIPDPGETDTSLNHWEQHLDGRKIPYL